MAVACLYSGIAIVGAEITTLRLLDGRFRKFAFADLVYGELSSANAAPPTRRRNCCDSGRVLSFATPGPYQFATALRTLSLNHNC